MSAVSHAMGLLGPWLTLEGHPMQRFQRPTERHEQIAEVPVHLNWQCQAAMTFFQMCRSRNWICCGSKSFVSKLLQKYTKIQEAGMTLIRIKEATGSGSPWKVLPQQLKAFRGAWGENHTVRLPGRLEELPGQTAPTTAVPLVSMAQLLSFGQDQVSTSLQHFLAAAGTVGIAQAALKKHLLPKESTKHSFVDGFDRSLEHID